MSARLQDRAVELVESGWHVFPCRPGAKVPLTRRGFHDATDDPGQVRRIWEEHARANIGVATGASRLLVIDLDTGGEGHCGDALTAWCALVADHGVLPPTLEVTTPSGGEHWYYRVPEGVELPRCSAGRLAPRVDVRCAGGYVLVPPSVLPAGAYVITNTCAVATAPAWLIDLCRPQELEPFMLEVVGGPLRGPGGDRAKAAARRRIDGACAKVALAPAGHRNATLNWAAHSLGEGVASDGLDLYDVVSSLALAASRSGLGEVETRRTIKSGLRSVGVRWQ
jgi:hypothetical protein